MDWIPPFTSADGMVRFINGTRARKKDLMIGNEGPEGSGKSTTSGNLAKALKPDFDMRRDTIKDMDHLFQVLHECKMGQVYVLDEAVNIFHNQDWATWEAKGLSKVIRQMRIMKSVWILNIPDYEGLHPYIRDRRIPLRIYHPPVYDEDGMGNGPSQVFWKHQFFSFKEQRVVAYWQCVIDEFHVPKLDALPEWLGYEQDKVDNFRGLITDLMKRRGLEKAKEQRLHTKLGQEPVAPTHPPLLRNGGPPKRKSGPSND